MKKKGYFEYDPMIYPRKLWVHIGNDFKDVVNSEFDGIILPDDEEEYAGVTYEKAERKSDKKYGILVSFPSKKDMTMGNVSHESSHVVDAIEKACGIDHGEEPSAYLFGWVASCINKARLGIGEFVDVNNRVTESKKPKKIGLNEIKEGEIIDCLIENGTRLIGRYVGTREECILMIPYILKDKHDLRKWCAMRDVNGRFHKGAVAIGRCVGLGYANGVELGIYKEMTKEYEAENKE